MRWMCMVVGLMAAWVAAGCRGASPDLSEPGEEAPPILESGQVLDLDDTPAAHALVTARRAASGRAITVYADVDGMYVLPRLSGRGWTVEARSAKAEAQPRAIVVDPDDTAGPIRLGSEIDRGSPRASSFLSQLPDGERKRSMIVDCGGCHVFDSLRMRKDGRDRTAEEWEAALGLMLDMYGPASGFPIISGQWNPAADAHWFAEALTGQPWPTDPTWPTNALARAADAVLTEFDMPEPADLAHDLAIDSAGQVVITGMFTHRMYVLDPGSGGFDTVPIPVENANPRAVDIDEQGRWWILLGAAAGVARYDPAGREWMTWPIGMYPHSIALDAQGDAWFNGHFSFDPELIAELDQRSGEIERVTVTPGEAGTESTIPYGLRVDDDDVVWGTQLRGNGLVRYDPQAGRTDVYPLPTSHSGPRRPDVGPDGVLWIPLFGSGALARFDPESESFTEYPFPVPDLAPYVVRVDPVRGTVWIGTGQGDLVAAFDPATESFALYPLPTRGALIRHLDIDERTGEVWATYSASPGIGGKVLRITPNSEI